MKNIIITICLSFLFLIPTTLDAATCTDNYNGLKLVIDQAAFDAGMACFEGDGGNACLLAVQGVHAIASTHNTQLWALCCITFPLNC